MSSPTFPSRILSIAGLLLAIACVLSASEPSVTVPPSEVDAILAALRKYEAAYMALDASSVQHVLPSLVQEQVEQIRRSFAALTTYQIEVRNPHVDIQSDIAFVDALVARRIVPRVGRAVANQTETRFRLRREERRWVIAEVTAPVSR
jgi:hypothetical protein